MDPSSTPNARPELAADAAERARADVDAHGRSAYQLGPGAAIEALLGATSFADAASVSEFAASRTAAGARSC